MIVFTLPSVCMSSNVLVHPAKAIGWNEIPFGVDARVVRRGPHSPQEPKGRSGGQNPQFAKVL